jgi:hypothetical protein
MRVLGKKQDERVGRLSLCLSLSVFLFLCVCVCLSLSVSLSLCLSLSLCVSLSLPFFFSVSPSLCLSLSLCVSLSLSVSASLFLFLFVSVSLSSMSFSFYVSLFWSVSLCLSLCVSVCLSVCLSCLSVSVFSTRGWMQGPTSMLRKCFNLGCTRSPLFLNVELLLSLLQCWTLNLGLVHVKPLLYQWATSSDPLFCLIFWDRISLCCQDWSWTHTIAQEGLELMIFLSQPPE